MDLAEEAEINYLLVGGVVRALLDLSKGALSLGLACKHTRPESARIIHQRNKSTVTQVTAVSQQTLRRQQKKS